MTLNQHVYATMNPITMIDPTGMGPIAGTTPTQEDIEGYSNYTHCHLTGGTNCAGTWDDDTYSHDQGPSVEIPEPAPPIDISAIVAMRGYVDNDTYSPCTRRCGELADTSGTLEAASFDEVRDESCGAAWWRCWDNFIINTGSRVVSEFPDAAVNIAVPFNTVDLVQGHECGNGNVQAICYEGDPVGWLVGAAGYGGLTIGNTINCPSSCEGVLNHELVHVAQYQEDGFGFIGVWTYQRISRGYCDIAYEIEARQLAGGGGSC